MIYLLQSPAKCCEACAKCFDNECCQSCSDALSDFFNKPLGGYVFMAVWLSALELGFLGYAIYDEDDKRLEECHLPEGMGKKVGIMKWIYVQMGLAVLNLVFAPYLQCRLWSRLMNTATTDAQATVGTVGLAVNKKAVKESFAHVFLYDFGVCLYVFALAFSYYWSWNGSIWANSSEACNPDKWISKSAGFGMFFIWFVVLYGIGWWFYMGCMSLDEGLPLKVAGGVAAAAAYQSPEAAQKNRQPDGEAPAPKGGVGGFLQGALNTATGKKPEPQQPPPPPAEAPVLSGFRKACQPRQLAKLVACIGLDFMGNASYLLPALGEVGDFGFAPAQAVALKMMFNANGIAALGLVEELLPYTDVVPTATIAWCLETFAPTHPITRMLGLSPEQPGSAPLRR